MTAPVAPHDHTTPHPRPYEHERPGELVHVDIKKLGNIPDSGGHRIMPRQQATSNRQATTDARQGGSPVIGYSFVHTAIDDHSRLAYSEVLTDERMETTDNGSCYRSRLFAQTLSAAGITHKRTRPYRPQTNGKVERLNRTLLDTYNHHRCHTALDGQPPISRVSNPAGQYN